MALMKMASIIGLMKAGNGNESENEKVIMAKS
jgi:hypothetical protein